MIFHGLSHVTFTSPCTISLDKSCGSILWEVKSWLPWYFPNTWCNAIPSHDSLFWWESVNWPCNSSIDFLADLFEFCSMKKSCQCAVTFYPFPFTNEHSGALLHQWLINLSQYPLTISLTFPNFHWLVFLAIPTTTIPFLVLSYPFFSSSSQAVVIDLISTFISTLSLYIPSHPTHHFF